MALSRNWWCVPQLWRTGRLGLELVGVGVGVSVGVGVGVGVWGGVVFPAALDWLHAAGCGLAHQGAVRLRPR